MLEEEKTTESPFNSFRLNFCAPNLIDRIDKNPLACSSTYHLTYWPLTEDNVTSNRN